MGASGPRNMTSVTRQPHFVQTPITSIFGEHNRSEVYEQTAKHRHFAPFFTLLSDIQPDKIVSSWKVGGKRICTR
jgi:hypothetical protein